MVTRVVMASIALMFLGCPRASAQVVVFENDFAGYLAAANLHGPLTTISFDDVTIPSGSLTNIAGNRYASLPGAPVLSAFSPNAQLAVADTTLSPSNGDLTAMSAPNVFVPFLPNSGQPQGVLIDLTFDGPVYSIGAWFTDVENGFGSTGFDLGADGTLEASFAAPQGDFSLAFLGLTSVTPFTSVRIHFASALTDDSVALDDLSYAVPEPSTWLLISSLAAGFAATRLKKRLSLNRQAPAAS